MTTPERFSQMIASEPRLRDVYDWAVQQHIAVGLMGEEPTSQQALAYSDLKRKVAPLVGPGRERDDELHTEEDWQVAMDYLRWVLYRDCYELDKSEMHHLD